MEVQMDLSLNLPPYILLFYLCYVSFFFPSPFFFELIIDPFFFFFFLTSTTRKLQTFSAPLTAFQKLQHSYLSNI